MLVIDGVFERRVVKLLLKARHKTPIDYKRMDMELRCAETFYRA